MYMLIPCYMAICVYIYELNTNESVHIHAILAALPISLHRRVQSDTYVRHTVDIHVRWRN